MGQRQHGDQFIFIERQVIYAGSLYGFADDRDVNLFVLQGMTKKEISYLARHAMPMFLLMVGAVLLIYFVPGIVTWLPGQMVG